VAAIRRRHPNLVIARTRLTEHRRELLRRYGAAISDEQAAYAGAEPDWLDAAAGHTAGAVLDRLGVAERNELEAVDAALDRIDDGIYGLCVMCHGRIADDRLAAIPEADMCIRCVEGGLRSQRARHD
jgi:RNA polymerase-binding transcription factor DksA